MMTNTGFMVTYILVMASFTNVSGVGACCKEIKCHSGTSLCLFDTRVLCISSSGLQKNCHNSTTIPEGDFILFVFVLVGMMEIVSCHFNLHPCPYNPRKNNSNLKPWIFSHLRLSKYGVNRDRTLRQRGLSYSFIFLWIVFSVECSFCIDNINILSR